MFNFRAEKEKMNEKMKEGEQQEEVDDSGFFSGKTLLSRKGFIGFFSYLLVFVLSPGGSVPQVGVTITMDDELLNGTNRVVLDGFMTEKECDRILQLAKVSPHSPDFYSLIQIHNVLM